MIWWRPICMVEVSVGIMFSFFCSCALWWSVLRPLTERHMSGFSWINYLWDDTLGIKRAYLVLSDLDEICVRSYALTCYLVRRPHKKVAKFCIALWKRMVTKNHWSFVVYFVYPYRYSKFVFLLKLDVHTPLLIHDINTIRYVTEFQTWWNTKKITDKAMVSNNFQLNCPIVQEGEPIIRCILGGLWNY